MHSEGVQIFIAYDNVYYVYIQQQICYLLASKNMPQMQVTEKQLLQKGDG